MIFIVEHEDRDRSVGHTFNVKTLNIAKAGADRLKISKGDTLRIYSEFMSLISTKEWGKHWNDNK